MEEVTDIYHSRRRPSSVDGWWFKQKSAEFCCLWMMDPFDASRIIRPPFCDSGHESNPTESGTYVKERTMLVVDRILCFSGVSFYFWDHRRGTTG